MIYVIVCAIVGLVCAAISSRREEKRAGTIIEGVCMGILAGFIIWGLVGGLIGNHIACKEIISENYQLCKIDGGTKEPPMYLFVDCSHAVTEYEFIVQDEGKPQKKSLDDNTLWGTKSNLSIIENSEQATYTIYKTVPVNKYYWLYSHVLFWEDYSRQEICVPADTIEYYYDIGEY